MLCDLFHWAAAYCAQSHWNLPIDAASPVAGYATPIVADLLQFTVALANLVAGAAAEPQAVVAATMEHAATSAAITPTFLNIRALLMGGVPGLRLNGY